MAARLPAMAAGGSDLRAGDVEEDASQLIFPKGGVWSCPTVPSFCVVTTGLASHRASIKARPALGVAGTREEGPADVGGPGPPWLGARKKVLGALAALPLRGSVSLLQ